MQKLCVYTIGRGIVNTLYHAQTDTNVKNSEHFVYIPRTKQNLTRDSFCSALM